MQFKRLKRYLSTFLAAAVILNTGAFDVMAAGSNADVKTGKSDNQAVSAPEKVYVDSYGVDGNRSVSFNDHWRFYLGELNGAETPSYNDSSWKSVNLPHDYSIDQGHTAAAPVEPESGLMLGGTGWYRKAFTLPSEVADKVVSVDFDGVYMNATVYLNGQKLGTHPYGYTPFSFVLPADVLNSGGQENILAVKVENKLPSSRWYSGSGIYRDVKLTVTDSVHVSYFGTTVTTPDIERKTGTVKVVTSVKNDSGEAKDVSVRQIVYEKGKMTEAVVTGQKTAAQSIAADEEAKIEASVTVPSPKLWDIGKPNLYTVRTEVYVGNDIVDTYDSDFGFRWVEFTLENGFFLNGNNIKMNGVCMHHDQGALGAEAWYRATERQVEKLMEMGVNTIRVTHNPASQVLIDICNEKGMLIIEEAFDCWFSGKNGNVEDYGKWFDREIEADNQIVGVKTGEKWSEFDLRAMVKRGRNAPSIVMWSLGNELFEGMNNGSLASRYPAMAEQLITWVGEEDATRYVTYGDNKIKGGGYLETAEKFATASTYSNVPGGVVGYNYANSGQVKSGHDRNWLVYGSETASSINSRGVYDRKSNGGDAGKGDKRLTSYDKSKVGWGALASEGMWVTMRQDFNAGEFIWTGFDYLGEPTPYNGTGTVGANNTWPNMAKSSYFGIIDLAGFPKDNFYLYQSQWNKELHTLHVLPVWNRDEIMVDNNGNVEVVVYSDAPVVKLYLNDEEVGTATATRTATPTGGYQNYTRGTGCFDTGKAGADQHTSLYATFNVPYQEGKLEAKAFDEKGNEITDTDGRRIVETTKNASRLAAEADRTEIKADGKDLSYITIDVLDQDGKFVNGAEPEITVTVEGNGVLMALDNGVQNDTSGYGDKTKKAGKGKLLAIVQSTKKAGTFTVKAEANGYTTASVEITTTTDGSVSEKRIESYELSRHYYVKEGETLQLPTSVKINYTDNTSESKSVTWDSLPSEDEFVVYGSVAGTSLRIPVYVTMIEDVAAILNYSAAIGVGSEFTLPATRPAVLPDGSILSAEFPVTWNGTVDSSKAETQTIQGTSSVFGKTINVSASVRVTKGGYKDGNDVLANAAEMYVNGKSSKEHESVAEVLTKLTDDKTSGEDAAWNGRGTIDFRLDTAISLKDFTLYLKDPAPVSGTMKIYSSGDRGENWNPIECTISNRRSNGVTVRSFTPKETVSETDFRVEFTKNATLMEMEVNTRIPTFTIGGEAALSSLKVGTYIADAASLNQGWFSVSDEELGVSDIQAVGKDNTCVTILPKDAEGVARMLLESEDHSVQNMYQVRFGMSNDSNDNAADDSLDYPYADMTLSAASYHQESAGGKEGSPHLANDGDDSSYWHSKWNANDAGQGSHDLTNVPGERYLQMALNEAKPIRALRYMTRPGGTPNGTVTKYQVKVINSNNEPTEEQWQSAEVVSEGQWSTAREWHLAKFIKTVQANYVRLYGVETFGDAGRTNMFMSAAEVRLRKPQQEISSKNITVTFVEGEDSLDYTGSELTPEPTVVYTGSGQTTLVKGTDYDVSYRNNIEPGKATVIVKGKGTYTGIVEAEFTINAVEETISDYEKVSVITGKGVYPELPGTVIANTNIGQKVMEVQWDWIASSRLNRLGTFEVQGTVIETDALVTAKVTVSEIVGVRQVTLATVVGVAPQMPETVTVCYSNGDTAERDVTWNLTGVSFAQKGIVKVKGTAGDLEAEASVRIAEQSEIDTPVGKNFALNANGINEPKKWPRTLAYFSSNGDKAHHATDGVKAFVTNSNKRIWNDWQQGKFHTNAEAAVGADDHVPFIISAFGTEGSNSNDGQQKRKISKVSLGFLEEDGGSASKVRLPQDYKIEYYSANNGVVPAAQTEGDSSNSCGNIKGWAADNTLKDHSSWTEVTYIKKSAVPALDDFKRMVDVEFKAVETTAIRITLQPQENNWTGLEEFEVYYVPNNTEYTVTAINVDGVNKLADFNADTKTLEIDAEDGVVTATADNNASVTVLRAVNGKVKVIFLPEDGDEAKKQEYEVIFTKADTSAGKHMVTARDEMVEIDLGEAALGETVTFSVKEGYDFSDDPVLLKSTDRKPSGLAVTKAEDGSYSFEMPDYPVTITGQVVPKTYQITYHLDGGQAANRESYTIETPYFKLNKPVKDGYMFLGWTGDGITEPTVDVAIANGSTGDLEFTANWEFIEVPITEITVEESEKEMSVGETYQIQASVVPEDTTDDKTLKYESLNKETATVDESGLVTAKAAGEAQIEVSSEARPDVKETVKVTVTEKGEKPDTQIKVEETAKTVLLGKTYQIEASLENPQNGDELKYKSSKEEIAAVDDSGLVTAKAVGTADIEIFCDRREVSPVTVKITVIDHEILITGIEVEETEASIEVGETYQIQASVVPEDTTDDKTLKYESLNKDKATVDENGLVTAKATGEAQIEVSSEARPDVKETVKVTVTEKGEKPDTQIKVEETAKTVLLGKTYQIEASLENPQNGDELKYKSSKEEIAAVDDSGLVTAKAVGTADIEIFCDRREVSPVTVKITVTDHEILITGIEVEETETSIKVGETYQIKASVVPEDTTEDTSLAYTSENPAFASVNDHGLVTAKAAGTAEIKISCANPNITAKVTVKVMGEETEEKAITEIKVEQAEVTVKEGETFQIQASAIPEDTTDDTTLTYKSTDEGKAEVDEKGLVTAKAAGAAKIQISCVREGVTAEVSVTIISKDTATEEQKNQLAADLNSLKAAYQDLSAYTVASANAFRDALARAEAVLNNPNATSAEVEQALAELAAAKAGLTLNPVTPTVKPPKKGYKFKSGALQYQVTKSSAKNGTVSVVKLVKKTSKKITIPATVKVKVKGKSFTFKVTQINSKVFQKNKKLKEVVIGANITKIGTSSFYNCKNLAKITFKGTKAPKAGSKAFTGIKKNAKVFVPKKVNKSGLKKFKTTMKTAGKRITIKKK